MGELLKVGTRNLSSAFPLDVRLVGNILVRSGLDMAAELATSILFQTSPEYWTLGWGGGRAYLEFSEAVRRVFTRRYTPSSICMHAPGPS